MTPERPIDHHTNQVLNFVLPDAENIRSKFVLRGSGNVPEESYHTFVAIFKNFDGKDALLTFGFGQNSIDAFSLNRAVSQLTIPREISDLGIKDEADGALYEAFFRKQGIPIAVVVFGHITSTGEDAVELFTSPGISPKGALSRIQQSVLEQTVRLN